MICRRRLLAITSAALVASPARADTIWHGRAMGAQASIRLAGQGAETALAAAVDTIRRMESLFSLHDPSSALSRLNRLGLLHMPPEFSALVAQIDRVHDVTNGLFDPTVQPLWAARAQGVPPHGLRTGWHLLRRDGHDLHLPGGMGLTFNGIAQGFATDRVRRVLSSHGFDDVVVNIGEYAVGRSPARIGIADLDGTVLSQLTLTDQAVATSNPDALRFSDGTAHILDPNSRLSAPSGLNLTVVADTATVADGLSTALALDPQPVIVSKILALDDVRDVIVHRS